VTCTVMSIAEKQDLQEYCREIASRSKSAAAQLALLPGAVKNSWLKQSAALLRSHTTELLAANAQDLKSAPTFGLSDAQIDRLKLTRERVEAMAQGLDEVAALADPIGEVIESSLRPNGLEVLKVRVPLGTVFFIYESRPNVTSDAAAICVKSGNAVILRGGKESMHSNEAIVRLLHEAAETCGVPNDAVQLVRTTDRSAVGYLLGMPEYIDVTIPRGGESLIRRVAAEAKMPVIKHFTGNCHVYIDSSADLEMAMRVTINAKCQRLGVCNACESLLVHADIAAEFLPKVGDLLSKNGIEIRGDQRTCELIPTAGEATLEDYRTEYLGPIISVKIVGSLAEAIGHINTYGSHHTDAIVTADLNTARRFAAGVDSSAVMINASTRFNDGGQIGLGAEIGISTDKFHARGPCGLKELTSYKYIVYGNGHIRE
jgi:glutamate-5-semialdehyde dehydrogenase